MIYDENWAVSLERARDFFAAQPDVASHGTGFRYKNCQITLAALPPQGPGVFSLPRTQVQISGPDEEAAAIHRRFFLRFLSAGG